MGPPVTWAGGYTTQGQEWTNGTTEGAFFDPYIQGREELPTAITGPGGMRIGGYVDGVGDVWRKKQGMMTTSKGANYWQRYNFPIYGADAAERERPSAVLPASLDG